MSTTVATTIVTTATSARPVPTICPNLYDTPSRDAVCAMPYSEDHIDYLKGCCNGAEIYSYYDDCGLYCAAEDQTVGDLTKCLYDAGAEYIDVFCRGNETVSATADGEPIASATVSSIANSDDSNDDDDNDNDSNDNNDDNDSNDDNSNDNDDDDNAAGVLAARSGVTVVGVVVSAMLLSAGVFAI